MAPSIIGNDVIQGEVFLPGQIFVFGSFALRANSLGHLEQIESYAPGHQLRFGSLNYTADIRGDLVFDGFEPVSGAPHVHFCSQCGGLKQRSLHTHIDSFLLDSCEFYLILYSAFLPERQTEHQGLLSMW